jgi:hypothetical protein
MKQIFLVFLIAYSLVGCSAEDNEDSARETPETFSVKYEILGNGEVPKIMYTSNDGTVEVEWDEDEGSWDVSGVRLPFVKEFMYRTEVDGEPGPNGFISRGCKRISISAYANRNDGTIEEMNIYINGELKESKKDGYYYKPGEHWTPWGSASYSYLRRGSDHNTYSCN